jgi:hypothetical protein
MPLIALARQVERSNRWGEKVPSEDSVTRALDQIYEETRDRRFQRAAKAARGEFLETLPMVLAQPLHFFDELASYRASGLVLWHFSDMAAMADDVRCRGYSGSRRSTRFHHRGVARFLGRKSENISNVDDDCQ